VAALHRWSMPLPEKHKSLTRVVIDRTASDVPLSKGAFYPGKKTGYGMLEQWIGRLGYYTIRQEGEGALSGDALVVICPDRPVQATFRERLKRYVAEGGRLIVFDSPENTGSTANSLLGQFGLSIQRDKTAQGALIMADKWPGIEVPAALEVSGGRPVARLGERPVAAIAKYEKGSIMAVGFASALNDGNMAGEEIWQEGPDPALWMIEPDAALRTRYEALYALVRLAVEDKPIEPPKESAAAGEDLMKQAPPDLPELPMQEHGLQE
jgi:hypothetical protein